MKVEGCFSAEKIPYLIYLIHKSMKYIANNSKIIENVFKQFAHNMCDPINYL